MIQITKISGLKKRLIFGIRTVYRFMSRSDLVKDGSLAAEEREHPGDEVAVGVQVRVADVEDSTPVGLVGVVAVGSVSAAVETEGEGHVGWGEDNFKP